MICRRQLQLKLPVNMASSIASPEEQAFAGCHFLFPAALTEVQGPAMPLRPLSHRTHRAATPGISLFVTAEISPPGDWRHGLRWTSEALFYRMIFMI